MTPRLLPDRIGPKEAALTAIAVIIILVATIALTGGEEAKVKYTPVEREIVDHTVFFQQANITSYEGSKTCMQCHYDETLEFFHSYHYQMKWENNGIAGTGTVVIGGKNLYNDFCGSIFWDEKVNVNFIGKAVLKAPPPEYENLTGTFIASGCSMCHGVTMGLIPSEEPTEEQLGNIDCLACHADPTLYMAGGPGVKKGMKIVYQDENGTWHYMINPNITIEEIARSIYDKPTSANCLACHAFSGGGPHFKRPNLGPDLLGNVSEEYDVHMANGLSCIDCHQSEDHHFPTSSADTWSREPGHVPSCTDCHGEDPHSGVKGWFLNTFHDRVACQVCHIPYIAHGEYPTDMGRNWSNPEFSPAMARYEPHLKLEKMVEPVYMWYNGSRQVYLFPGQVQPDEEGKIIYVQPLGSRDDPDSKIYPYKLHYAIVPYSQVNETLVPVKVGIVFATGNVTKAVQVGGNLSHIEWDGDWVMLVRYMQVNHGVQPADNALSCLNCHGPTVRRMPWSELGYGHFPEIAFITMIIAVVAVIAYIGWRLMRR